MIKAIYLDFDGTIFSHFTESIPESAVKALKEVSKKGVDIFLCSGRSKEEMDCFDLKGIPFKGYIYVNGQLGRDKDNKTIFNNLITGLLKEKLIELFNSKTITICITSADDFYANFHSAQLIKTYNKLHTPIPHEREYRGEDFYMCSAFLESKDDKKIFEEIEKISTITYFYNGGLDIVSKGASKAIGIIKTNEYYGYKIDEVIGIGDGENDIPMLKECGIGIAMGNGEENTKKVANYITSDIDDDGIYNALKHYNLI